VIFCRDPFPRLCGPENSSGGVPEKSGIRFALIHVHIYVHIRFFAHPMGAPREPSVVLADPNIAKYIAAVSPIRINQQTATRKNHFPGARADLFSEPPGQGVCRLRHLHDEGLALRDESTPVPVGWDCFAGLAVSRTGRGASTAGVPEVLPASPKQERCYRAGYQATIRHIEPVPKVCPSGTQVPTQRVRRQSVFAP